MRAAVLREHGGLPRVGEFAEPQPAEGQAVIEVLSAGMNPVELAIASGRFYGMVPELPSIVGREAVGRRADGQRGYVARCVPPFGSMAERALIPEQAFIPLPDGIDDGLAVALGTAGLAAWLPLERAARLQRGERVLVLGASGVVGQLAVQAASIMGAGCVVAAARSAAGLARATELGADATVALDGGPDLAGRVREAAGGDVDVVLDLLYGEPLVAALGALAPWSRVAQVGSSAGAEITLPAAALRSRNAALIGYTSANVAPRDLAAAYLTLVDHAIASRLTLEVERVPLDDVGDAWRRQADGPHHKLVVVP